MQETPQNLEEMRLLSLASVNANGRALGLLPGDILEAVDGAPFGDGIENLVRLLDNGTQRTAHLMRFSRGDVVWSVLADTARLGQWRIINAQRLATDLRPRPDMRTGYRNWIVLCDRDGFYDAHPVRPTWFGLLAPLHLLQMRLYGPLAIWGAVVLCGLPLGVVPMAGLALLASVYFWLATPALFRADRAARGYMMCRVMAARSEADLHRRVARTDPHLRFVLARRQRIEEPLPSTVE